MALRRLLRAGLLGSVAAVCAVTAQAQSWYTPGPYYAVPAWSQKFAAGGRFLVLTDWNNEAVLDRETGLVWQRSPAANHVNQFAAIGACEAANIGGRFGWRLPLSHELSSLLDPSVTGSGPFVSKDHPFNVPGAVGDSVFWSASSSPANPAADGTVVTFFASPGVAYAPKLNLYWSWCVRGGSSAKP